MIGLTDESVRLLGQVEGLELRPLDDADECCGFGGTFAVKFSGVSGAMARTKVDRIRATGAPVVVSNESGCTMNLSGTCRREGLDVAFLSVAELIAESLGLLAPEER